MTNRLFPSYRIKALAAKGEWSGSFTGCFSTDRREGDLEVGYLRVTLLVLALAYLILFHFGY